MKLTYLSMTLMAATLLMAACQSGSQIDKAEDLTAIPAEHLISWDAYGRGTVQVFRNQAIQMTEEPDSAGVMIVSPRPYGTHTSLRFRAMTLTPGTVLVAIHSASGLEPQTAPSLPEDYQGDIAPWLNQPCYFFAMHNAPHLRHPFVMRTSGDSPPRTLREAERHHMTTGTWHDIEVIRNDNRLRLRIDHNTVLDTLDPDPHGPGHLALRIRGTGTQQASCLITDLSVTDSSGH